MKKICIVTLYDNFNYGNKLQNYAVFKLLSKYGEVLNIKNNRHLNYVNNNYFKSFIKFLMSQFKYFIKHRNEIGWKYYNLRVKNFKDFSSLIPSSNDFFSYKKFEKFNVFDYCVVGSDQVWNPYMCLDDLSLLKKFSGNRIALSASFGVNELEITTKKNIRNELNKFKSISVREDAGKTICDNILNNNKTEVLIDPTMMIDKTEWKKLSKKPNFEISDKYILVTFLGQIPQSAIEKINSFAKDNNYQIINLYEKNSIYTSTGPSEFLYLEEHASLICTDSFHSSVFGIIMDTPILVFDRVGTKENMNSRINTLLSKFNLRNRKYSGKTITLKTLEHDYTEAYKILEKERKKSKEFIEKALEVSK